MQAMLVLCVLTVAVVAEDIADDSLYRLYFDSFKARLNRIYDTHYEHERSFNIFKLNMKHARKIQALQANAPYQITTTGPFADQEHSQFVAQRCGYEAPPERTGATWSSTKPTMLAATASNGTVLLTATATVAVPATKDWRLVGAVGPVLDQGPCGACWAFAAAASLESQIALQFQVGQQLSPQMLLDCSSNSWYGNLGCNGGCMQYAYNYIYNQKYCNQLLYYPYTAAQQSCTASTSKGTYAQLAGYVHVPANSESALMQVVGSVGPVAVAIDASWPSFQMYTSGVYNEPQCSNTTVNHAVLVVGYGTDTANTGMDYWIIKNSWGTGWGMSGFFWLARNNNNKCGVASNAIYPTLY